MRSSIDLNPQDIILSSEIIAKIKLLESLSGDTRIMEEFSLFPKLEKILHQLYLTKDQWIEICNLIDYFRDKKIAILTLLFARAPSEEKANELMALLPEKVRKNAVAERLIWLRIVEIENTHYDKEVISAHQMWGKLSCLFLDNNKHGRRIAGLSLKPDYWFEGFNQGRWRDEKWFAVWKQSKNNLSFIKWCDLLGVNSTSVPYYSDEERKSLQIHIVDGQMYDSANQLINTGCYGDLTDCVMMLDEQLYCYATSTFKRKSDAYHFHSGLVAGKPIIFAGQMSVERGVLTFVTTRSGHYEPSDDDLCKFLKVLNDKGIKLDHVNLQNEGGGLISYSAEAYLADWQVKNGMVVQRRSRL